VSELALSEAEGCLRGEKAVSRRAQKNRTGAGGELVSPRHAPVVVRPEEAQA